MRLTWLWLLLMLSSACVALSSIGCASRPHYQHVVERPLSASEGLVCPGYLAWNSEPVTDVFLVINGSGALSNAFVHPSFKSLLSSHRIGYMTYDKPGIHAPFDDPAALRRDYAMLERYTLGHGVSCATDALRWAREQFGASVRIHVRGHSEGTLVALYTYDALLKESPETAANIVTFVLSGLALEPFADILERQLTSLPNGKRLREALTSCDWDFLKESVGVSCIYVNDAKERPSGRAMFERLSTRSPAPPAKFHIFHGTGDWHTPVAPVRGLESWNDSSGHLDITFHYYEGGHAGSDSARKEAERLLTSLVAE